MWKTHAGRGTREEEPSSGDTRFDEFWRRNPKGIDVVGLLADEPSTSELAATIRAIDSSGDGYLSAAEFQEGMNKLVDTRELVKKNTKIALALVAALLLLLAAIGGLMFE